MGCDLLFDSLNTHSAEWRGNATIQNYPVSDGLPDMNKIRRAKYAIGQVVRHRVYPFRGVVFDIDPLFSNTEEWYQSIPS